MKRICLSVLTLVCLAACGPTVGDACTTAQECGGRLCLNAEGEPGGYCSQTCKLDDGRSCPSGSLCVRDGLAKDAPACFRICASAADCRTGYVCRVEKESSSAICIGPAGI
jgi:hypothetical protein